MSEYEVRTVIYACVDADNEDAAAEEFSDILASIRDRPSLLIEPDWEPISVYRYS